MASTEVATQVGSGTPGAPATLTRREEVAVAFFGAWAIIGLFLDGWAHQADKPETFFSPWHGVLYSGFAAAQLFFLREGWRQRRTLDIVRGAPDRLMAAGLVLFGAGAVGDFVWHEIFGIEVDLEALLSPTHLALMTGGLLMLTGPVRSAWRRTDERSPSFRAFFPTLVCLSLTTALASFFLMYLSPFRSPEAVGVDTSRMADRVGEPLEIMGIAAVLVANALLVGAMLVVLRRWTPPFGAFAFLFGTVAVMTSGLAAFEFAPLVVPAVAAGLVADVMVGRSASPRVTSAVVPLILWVGWFAVYHAAWGVGWAAELWVGSVVLAVLGGVGLSVLAFPSRAQRGSLSV